jgi:hypothetical protein
MEGWSGMKAFKKTSGGVIAALGLLGASVSVLGDEGVEQPASSEVSSGSAVSESASESSPLMSKPRPTAGKKGRRREQKETEGSQAPGRFQADTIIKSVYTRDGQPLEVDPD